MCVCGVRRQATLQWPTSLAINPVDQSVYILDRDVIVQLSSGRTLTVLVAAAGAPCAFSSQPRPVIINWRHSEPADIAVAPSGRRLMTVDHHTLHAVDLLTGHVTQYVTMTSSDNASLSSLTVRHDGVIYVTDVNNAIVYTVTSRLPAPHHVTGNYDVMDPTTQQRYTFNRLVDIFDASVCYVA